MVGHVERAFRSVSSNVQMVVCFVGDRFLCPNVVGCDACGGTLREFLIDRLGLLVRILLDYLAPSWRDRKPDTPPATIEDDFAAHYGGDADKQPAE